MTRPCARCEAPGSSREIRLSSAVMCGLSAIALQTAAVQREPCGAAPADEGIASTCPDRETGGPAPSVGSLRRQACLGSAPASGGPASPGSLPSDNPAFAGPAARESAFVAAALAASRLLTSHPLRGPPRLPS